MQFGDFLQLARAARRHKFLRRLVHEIARAFRKFHLELVFQHRDAFHKFIPRQQRVFTLLIFS